MHLGEALTAVLLHTVGTTLSPPKMARARNCGRFAMPGACLAKGRSQMGLAVTLGLGCYLLPAELLALRGSHLIPVEVRLIGQQVKQRLVELSLAPRLVRGFPLQVPVMHASKAKRRRLR